MKRAVTLSLASSILVPLAGLITAPLLARGLGADGRGELAAVLAPGILMLAVAAIGLPESLTFHLANNPGQFKRLLALSLAPTFAVSALFFTAIWLCSSWLAGGDERLAHVTVVATGCAIPLLYLNLIRGAAIGLQMWRATVVERVLGALLRIIGLAALLIAASMTLYTALAVSLAAPVLAVLAYRRLLKWNSEYDGELSGGTGLTGLLRFGRGVWFGAIASMLLARVPQLLILPLAGPTELGLFVVATTVSDVPATLATAVAAATFGVSSRERDARSLATASRFTFFVCLSGASIIAATSSMWLIPLFGDQFGGAILPMVLLMASAVIGVPGMVASSGLPGWGRPGLRSIGYVVTLGVSVVALVLLVPSQGAVGAALAGVIAAVVNTSYMTVVSALVVGVRWYDFVIPRPGDIAFVRSLLSTVSGRIRRVSGSRNESR